MAKKKKTPKPRQYRNAPPRAPRTPEDKLHTEDKLHPERLAYTALGAVGTAILGGFLAKQDWSPKTIATAVTVAGGVMAAGGKTDKLQAVGSGAFGAGG